MIVVRYQVIGLDTCFIFTTYDIYVIPIYYDYWLNVESKTRTYHGRVGSGRTAGWRGGVGQDWLPTELFA